MPAKRSRNSICAWLIFSLAKSAGKNSARSISGKSWVLPERGGHSIANVFERRTKSGGNSPSNAQARTVFPPFCFTVPSSIQSEDAGSNPSSSSNSSFARERRSSPSEASPFGIVHAPPSLLRKNGPPGWTSKTSTVPYRRRNISNPALNFVRFACFKSRHGNGLEFVFRIQTDRLLDDESYRVTRARTPAEFTGPGPVQSRGGPRDFLGRQRGKSRTWFSNFVDSRRGAVLCTARPRRDSAGS